MVINLKAMKTDMVFVCSVRSHLMTHTHTIPNALKQDQNLTVSPQSISSFFNLPGTISTSMTSKKAAFAPSLLTFKKHHSCRGYQVIEKAN